MTAVSAAFCRDMRLTRCLRKVFDPLPAMMAKAGPYPREPDAYAFEVKWDGIRCLAHCGDGALLLRSRNLHDVTARYPELAGLASAIGSGREAILDGEIVAPDEHGHPSFSRLQQRMNVDDPHTIARRAAATPVVLMIFDLLWLDGEDLTSLPYDERRARLEALSLSSPHWAVSARLSDADGSARALLEEPAYEGIIAKRRDSRYLAGQRSAAWLKIKRMRRQEFVVGGWTPGQGARAATIGALLLGCYDAAPPNEGPRDGAAENGAKSAPRLLRFAGSVGSGFDDATLAVWRSLLDAHALATSPFATDPLLPADARWVEPGAVVEVEFFEWTTDGHLRHPSYKGLRTDKDPHDVVREDP